jgi:type II secretory pathway pseudopilin PulG
MEVVVAMSVLTIAIAGAAFMLTSAYGAYRHQNRTMDVDRLVHNQMETFTAVGYPEWRKNLQNGRRKDTPPTSPPPPGDDYIYWGGGEATSTWDLEPPTDDKTDWQPRPVTYAVDGKPLQAKPKALRATVRLQFWDPTFDSPAATDRGLIRATFSLEGDGVREQATKYLAREQWGDTARD